MIRIRKVSSGEETFGNSREGDAVKYGMKFVFAMFVMATTMSSVWAQQSNTVTGKLKIDYPTRKGVEYGAAAGTMDAFAFNLNVTDKQIWAGTLTYLPPVPGEIMAGKQGALTANINMQLNIGGKVSPASRMYGAVPISGKNVYMFDQGTLQIAKVNAGATGWKFGGVAVGKPFKMGHLEQLKQKAESVKKQVKGQVQTLVVTNYDRMAFNNLILAAGPIDLYTEAVVSGTMLYDGDRYAWYPQLTVTYTDARTGKQLPPDTIGGTILWTEDPVQGSIRNGRYTFDVRVNEPVADETKAVEAQVLDEDAFFLTDPTVTSLAGTMSYIDQMSGGAPISSDVTIDLVGNGLTKQQLVYLTKLFQFVMVVPMNNE